MNTTSVSTTSSSRSPHSPLWRGNSDRAAIIEKRQTRLLRIPRCMIDIPKTPAHSLLRIAMNSAQIVTETRPTGAEGAEAVQKGFLKVHRSPKLDRASLSFDGGRRCRRCRFFEKLFNAPENSATIFRTVITPDTDSAAGVALYHDSNIITLSQSYKCFALM